MCPNCGNAKPYQWLGGWHCVPSSWGGRRRPNDLTFHGEARYYERLVPREAVPVG